jgi:hypothetical protein
LLSLPCRFNAFNALTLNRITPPQGTSPSAGAGTNLPLMTTDEVPPDVPQASLNPEKDPDKWVTKDEPMTGPQRSYLRTLCREAKEEYNENWTKAEASKKIDELQQKTGRGKSGTPDT